MPTVAAGVIAVLALPVAGLTAKDIDVLADRLIDSADEGGAS